MTRILILTVLALLAGCTNDAAVYAKTVNPDAQCYDIRKGTEADIAVCTTGDGTQWYCTEAPFECRVIGERVRRAM